MQGTTLCALGDFAANPIIATIENFADEFQAYAEQKAIEAAEGEEADAEAEPAPAGD